MAKVKSVKFYNFNNTYPGGISIYVKFYNKNGKLVILDFSSPSVGPTSTYCETSECIVTASGSENYIQHYPQTSFHTGNYNKTIGLNRIGRTWWLSYPTKNDYIKIEFKVAEYFSDIQVLHSCYNINNTDNFGFNKCDYDVEYSDGSIEQKHYISSDSTPSPIEANILLNNQYDQELYDSLFDSIGFSKSIYDSETGLIETLDTNNFRNISVNTIEKLKVLYTKPLNTYINCLVSFDQKQTWKTFNGTVWSTISNTSPENIILNCMDIETLNHLTKQNLIQAGFTGDLDFKIAIKTNDEKVTPSVSKIYITYKNPS